MKRSNIPWCPIPTAALEWSANNEPSSLSYGDVYFSKDGALEESRHNFINGNKLPERWVNQGRESFCIFETGFGTGLNFLLTWSTFLRQQNQTFKLHYISVERHPLSRDDLVRAHANWPELAELSATLLMHYPEPLHGQHRIVLDQGRVILDLWWEDVADALGDLAASGNKGIDAWYLDGFSPACNEQMWRPGLFPAMAAASRAGATFSTFTAAGDVRRGLEGAGFLVDKAPGFGQKREQLRGYLPSELPSLDPEDTPWEIADQVQATPNSVLILGAGLAGCTTAAALAQRGINVVIVEQNQLASAASSNDQGILYTRLSVRHSALSDFALQSFCYAHRFYGDLFAANKLAEGEDGALCGSFHQADNSEELTTLGSVLAQVPDLAQILNADQATRFLGVEQPLGGYWFPKSGWLRPASICRTLIDNPRIQLLENTGQVELVANETGWQAQVDGRPIAEAQCAVIAAGISANRQEACSWLPLQTIRGQTTNLPTDSNFSELRAGLCHKGYISPTRQGVHCIGATFDIGDMDANVRAADHRRNLDALADAVPPWREMLAAISADDLTGNVGFRCASPDYLPMVGAVPNRDAFLHSYRALGKNARQTILQRGKYMPGLFLTTAHGSRGLTYTPLAAEILASQICGEPVPLNRELRRAISPARFIIRQLRRGRV